MAFENMDGRALNKQCACGIQGCLKQICTLHQCLGAFSHCRALLSIAQVLFLCYKFLELKPEKQAEPPLQEPL